MTVTLRRLIRRAHSHIVILPEERVPKIVVSSSAHLEQLEALERSVMKAAEDSVNRLKEVLREHDALTALARLKFATVGSDPLDHSRSLNFVEQMNQSFTYLATFEAARHLFNEHPNCESLTLNLGTAAGSDIRSNDGTIAAEVFSATHPHSNDKLRKDIDRVRQSGAGSPYVFYLCATTIECDVADVRVVALTNSRLADMLASSRTPA